MVRESPVNLARIPINQNGESVSERLGEKSDLLFSKWKKPLPFLPYFLLRFSRL